MNDLPNVPEMFSTPEALQEWLRDAHKALIDRANQLISVKDRIPSEVVDDIQHGKVADTIKMINGCKKALENARDTEKMPYDQQVRAVNGFFNTLRDSLIKVQGMLKAKSDDYLRAVAEAERKRRQQEAEERRRLAEEERRQAEERRRAEAEAAAAEARRKAEEAETERQLQEAIDAEENAKKVAESVSERVAEDVVTHEGVAKAAAKLSNAKSADLSRRRSVMGTTSSLREYWEVGDIDRKTVDLEALRGHLSMECIQRAARAFVLNGGRELEGVDIFKTDGSMHR